MPGQRTPGPKVTFVSGSLITITQTGRTTSATARPRSRSLAQLQPSIGSDSLQRLNEGPVPCSTQQSILQAKGEQEREIVQREGVRTGGRGDPLSFVPHRSAQLPASSFAAWLNKFAASHCCHGKLVGVTYLLSTFTFESDFLARVTRVDKRKQENSQRCRLSSLTASAISIQMN